MPLKLEKNVINVNRCCDLSIRCALVLLCFFAHCLLLVIRERITSIPFDGHYSINHWLLPKFVFILPQRVKSVVPSSLHGLLVNQLIHSLCFFFFRKLHVAVVCMYSFLIRNLLVQPFLVELFI